MRARAKLEDFIEAIELQAEESSAYLNTRTGKVAVISEEEIRAAEAGDALAKYPEWQRPMIEVAREILASAEGVYLELPGAVDIHEYGIMERFCLSIEDGKVADSLLSAIQGKGAFRRFKDAINRHGIVDDWHSFRAEEIRRAAKDWCEENGIEFDE